MAGIKIPVYTTKGLKRLIKNFRDLNFPIKVNFDTIDSRIPGRLGRLTLTYIIALDGDKNIVIKKEPWYMAVKNFFSRY